jgi:hypothetical protein
MPDELDTMQDKANAKTTAVAGRMAPSGAAIQPSTYNAFKGVVAAAIDTFSGGQVELEEVPDATGPVDQVHPTCARNAMALEALFAKLPQGEPYRFDLDEALGSDAGMADATATIGSAMKDQKLVTAAQAPAKGAPPAAKGPPKPPAAKGKAAPPEKSGKDAEFYMDGE